MSGVAPEVTWRTSLDLLSFVPICGSLKYLTILKSAVLPWETYTIPIFLSRGWATATFGGYISLEILHGMAFRRKQTLKAKPTEDKSVLEHAIKYASFAAFENILFSLFPNG